MSDKAKPAHKIRHRGLTVTIWKNASDNGPWFSVTPSRVYKHGDEWREANSYSDDELLLLAQLLEEAHQWIRTAEQAERQAA
jgi:hypothetical protein